MWSSRRVFTFTEQDSTHRPLPCDYRTADSVEATEQSQSFVAADGGPGQPGDTYGALARGNGGAAADGRA